ncbi:MAG: amidohydrolase family protein [Alphaproteobacteria bacterium]|nr:amidohydrolase family protein [Alphaproteobacteria bacterium]
METGERTAIRARWVLAHEDGRPTLLEDRWVVVEGGRIAAVDRGRPAGCDVVVDRPGLLVLPGLINMHNHCFTELLVRSRTEDMTSAFMENGLVYGLLMPLGKLAMERLSAAERRAALRLGVLQLILGGATTVMESFRSGLADVFAVAEEMGIRFWGVPYVFSTPDIDVDTQGKPVFGGAAGDGTADIAEWRALHQRWAGAAGGRIQVGLGPHAPDTCGPDLLRAVRRLADETGCLVTTHLAQTKSEVEHTRRLYGRTPAEYLQWVGLLGPDLSVAHSIFSTDADLDLLKATGTTVINCPRTFARTGTWAPFARFAERGLKTVIGTDGYNMDLVSELGAAGQIAKLHAGESGVATARQLVDAVTLGAAAALKRDDLGRVAPGARADLTAIDLSKPRFQPQSDPLRSMVWRGSAADVSATMVDGRLLVEGGRYLPADENAIATEGAAAFEKIWSSPEGAAIRARAG